MPKRKSSKGFGGGTGDVNPQWFNLTGNATGLATAYNENGNVLPRERLPYGNKSQVMEILKVQFTRPGNQTIALTAATFSSLRMYLTTSSFGTTEPVITQLGGKVIAFNRWEVANTAAAPAVNIAITSINDIIDITDDAGNGLLVATDSIFVGAIEVGLTVAANASYGCRVLYRWKNVGLSEYIGIVQSQQ